MTFLEQFGTGNLDADIGLLAAKLNGLDKDTDYAIQQYSEKMRLIRLEREYIEAELERLKGLRDS